MVIVCPQTLLWATWPDVYILSQMTSRLLSFVIPGPLRRCPWDLLAAQREPSDPLERTQRAGVSLAIAGSAYVGMLSVRRRAEAHGNATVRKVNAIVRHCFPLDSDGRIAIATFPRESLDRTWNGDGPWDKVALNLCAAREDSLFRMPRSTAGRTAMLAFRGQVRAAGWSLSDTRSAMTSSKPAMVISAANLEDLRC